MKSILYMNNGINMKFPSRNICQFWIVSILTNCIFILLLTCHNTPALATAEYIETQENCDEIDGKLCTDISHLTSIENDSINLGIAIPNTLRTSYIVLIIAIICWWWMYYFLSFSHSIPHPFLYLMQKHIRLLKDVKQRWFFSNNKTDSDDLKTALILKPLVVEDSQSPMEDEDVRYKDMGQLIMTPNAKPMLGGRDIKNHIVFSDPYVSRRHFRIQYDKLQRMYYLEDMGSTSGTFLFVQPNVPMSILENDVLKFGETEVKVIGLNSLKPKLMTPSLSGISTNSNEMSARAGIRLSFIAGPLAGSHSHQNLNNGPVFIGRRSSNTLVVARDSSISGVHAELSFNDGKFYITDLGSTNGTAIRLRLKHNIESRQYLKNGDIIGVGSNRLSVLYKNSDNL